MRSLELRRDPWRRARLAACWLVPFGTIVWGMTFIGGIYSIADNPTGRHDWPLAVFEAIAIVPMVGACFPAYRLFRSSYDDRRAQWRLAGTAFGVWLAGPAILAGFAVWRSM